MLKLRPVVLGNRDQDMLFCIADQSSWVCLPHAPSAWKGPGPDPEFAYVQYTAPQPSGKVERGPYSEFN